MTIPKRGRRTITVDDVAFHFKASFERAERIVIQHASGRGACLFIFPHAVMTPTHIADAIRFAITKGWPPGTKGADCWLAFDVDSTGKSLLEFIPADDFRVVAYPTGGTLPGDFDASQFPDQRRWYERPIDPEK